MPDDLEIAKTTLAQFHQNMEDVNRMVKPSYLSAVEELDRLLEPIRRQQLETKRACEMFRETVQAQQITGLIQNREELLKQTVETNPVIRDLKAVHQSLIESIKPIQHDFSNLSQLQASAKPALYDTSRQLVDTKRIMAGIDLEAIRARFQIEIPVISGLENSLSRMSASYGDLAESFREISDITCLPDLVLPGATREIYTNSLALKALCSSDWQDEEEDETEIQLITKAEQESSSCITLLKEIDPRLTRLYIGARDALYDNNPERARHILISLREMWSFLLKRLAPDDLVSAWIPGVQNQEGLLHEGKPTRRARILYVCRKLNSDRLTDFLMCDTQALLELIKVFNRIHELDINLNDEQLKAILLRSDSWLMYVIQVSMGNFHSREGDHFSC